MNICMSTASRTRTAKGTGMCMKTRRPCLTGLPVRSVISVKKMVEDGRDCSEVLIQLSAVRSAINNIGKVILEDHIQHCIVDAVELGDQEAIANLCQAIDKFVK